MNDRGFEFWGDVWISLIISSPLSPFSSKPPCTLDGTTCGVLTLKPVMRSAIDSVSAVSGDDFVIIEVKRSKNKNEVLCFVQLSAIASA